MWFGIEGEKPKEATSYRTQLAVIGEGWEPGEPTRVFWGRQVI